MLRCDRMLVIAALRDRRISPRRGIDKTNVQSAVVLRCPLAHFAARRARPLKARALLTQAAPHDVRHTRFVHALPPPSTAHVHNSVVYVC